MLIMPDNKIKCNWIEVYMSRAQNPPEIAHHDNVYFWKDKHGDLVVYKGGLYNPVVYRDFVKYVISSF